MARPKLKVAFTDHVYGVKAAGLLLRALQMAFEIEESDQPEVVFFGEGREKRFLSYDAKRVYVAVENRYPDFSEYDFAMTFLHLKDARHLRMPLYVFNSDPNQMLRDECYPDRVLNESRGFCSFLVSNGSPRRTRRRIAFFKALSKHRPVDSGGRVLNNIGHLIEDKLDFLSHYRFHLAFENERFPGYTTEKIVHPMMRGAIPIYWGNPRIDEEFNPKSFINVSKFQSDEAAIDHILKVASDQSLQREYLSQPCFHHNQPNKYYSEERLAAFLTRIADAPKPKRPRFFLPAKSFTLKRGFLSYFNQ